MTPSQVKRDLREVASRRRAEINRWFFKTGPGQYGEGDRFLGVSVPALRLIARKYDDLPLDSTRTLLKSPWHEERLLALLILTRQYARADRRRRSSLYRFYLRHSRWINNWDLVDLSAAQIVGTELDSVSRAPLRRLARSKSLWERRIAIVATYHYIRQRQFDDTLAIAEILLGDDHDLIHKAVGWMLREVGKRDRPTEERFLQKHGSVMPRTMLRYSIERFPLRLRRTYLRRKIAR